MDRSPPGLREPETIVAELVAGFLQLIHELERRLTDLETVDEGLSGLVDVSELFRYGPAVHRRQA